MLQAIRMINDAKARESGTTQNVVVDLHPNRPVYRGVMAMKPVSLEADPTFEEIAEAGGKVEKHDQPHTVLDDMFLISGEIPRKTSYEKGIRQGIRYIPETQTWEDDPWIMDERSVMCRLKGTVFQ
jgi:7,8-dihydropterin-6-yl-methyl-4-(beta-D-ribofuranosyl)aminobenzene 5'-phosphate synthase